MNRRKAIKQAALGTAGLSLLPQLSCASEEGDNSDTVASDTLKGNVNHSVCRWCYNKIPLEELCEGAKEIGIQSIEITNPDDWKVMQKYGLTSAMGTHKAASLTKGFNHTEYHETLLPQYIELIDQAADSGVKNIIVFSGNRAGIGEEEGLENCAVGLDKIIKHAEKKNIMVAMELLNSKVNHKDYQCDKTPWGAALVDKIGSPNFKLLYDIYHMQIMEGDIIATIRKYKDYIAHYHTGGVPGRNEINETQELNYPAVMKAILETGYTGFVGQEFVPTWEDQLAALKQGVMICDV